MLNTQAVVTHLKKNGETDFDKIWKAVKGEILMSLTKDLDELTVKTDLHTSMIEDKRIIMTGKNKWDLSNNYSSEQTTEIQRKILGDELEKAMEYEKTQELKSEDLLTDEKNDDED